MTVLPAELDEVRTEVSDDPYQESLDLVCARCRTVIGTVDHWGSVLEIARVSLSHATDGTCRERKANERQ